MFAFVGGFALAIILYNTTGLTWILAGLFWLGALALQVFYAHRLNFLLGGIDPVATFGTRNLRQLRNTNSIPLSIIALNFFAKTLFWAGVGAIFFSFGWFKIETL